MIALLPVFALLLALSPSPAAARTTLSFDADWRFFKGEPAGRIDAASFAFKDADWRTVNLPHDWSIEGPFDEKAPTGSAGANLPSGVSWYRKTFTLPPEAAGQRVFIEFDGVMSNSEVYINKSLLGHRPFGYSALRYELTNYLDLKGPNLLAVRTDTTRQPASRAYAGAGINRHTRLVIQDPVHLEHWATFITTPKVDPASATIHLETSVMNQTTADRDIALEVTFAAPGSPASAPIHLPTQKITAGKTATFTRDIPLDNPHLWDVTDPFRYTATVRVLDGAKVLDDESTPFGIRTAEFKADTGFWLNGKNIKLLGVCLHHDAGALGVAVPESAYESRLSALKQCGVNAIRTAHNPPSPEFLDACDRLGLMVMDEAFDCWSIGKEAADYHVSFKDWWEKDLAAMILRDRNHPSIVLYSLGNEIWDILPQNPDPAPDQFTGPMRSIDIAKTTFLPMRDLAHRLDPSRPVTLAVMRPNVSGTYTNGFAELVDVVGQNYRDNELAAAHVQNPARKILGTESYKTREAWIALRDNPALSGQFLWAGVDYFGEAGGWPNVVSPSGILDRTNFPKGEALERQAWWTSKPVLHLARMQTIPTRPGRPPVNMGFANWTPTPPSDTAAHNETVSAYSNCDEVELFLNDQSLGVKPKDPADAPRQWQVPFAPGTLKAIAKNKGQPAATDELRTAGAPAKIILQAERTTLPNDFDDVVYVRVFIADSNGITNPNATNKVKFTLTGPGTLVAVDNGDITSHELFQTNERSAYRGTCIAILRATADAGEIALTASADGLTEGATKIQAAPAQR